LALAMAVFIEFMCGWELVEFWKACPFNHFCTQVAGLQHALKVTSTC